jgi:hypothetical protein
VSTSDNDGTFEGEGTFDYTIDKPREASQISVLPRQINGDSKNYNGEISKKSLTVSYPCVKIYNSSKKFKDYTPMVYTGGKWKEVIPVVRKDGKWLKLFNTDTETM